MLFAPLYVTDAPSVTMKLVPSGATAKVGGYRPEAAEFGPTPTAKAPKWLTNPQYGKLKIVSKEIACALSEPADKDAVLVVDTNANGTLADDPKAEYSLSSNPKQKIWFGKAMVNIGKSAPVAVNFYRFDPKAEGREKMKSTLLYYPDFGYEIGFNLDGKPYTTFIAGEPTEQTSFGIDRNNDGRISAFRERIMVGKPFNFTGTTYTFQAKNGALALSPASETLPESPMPPNLAIGSTALPIQMTALDGQPVDLLKDYKGKLVMVDFWATWCGPCIAELPNVKAAYEKYHDQGFDILGVSFDDKDMADKLKAFTKEKGMPWRQVYEGKGWGTQTGLNYDVSAIPFVLLVDGDTGKILADESELRGPGLSDFIAKKLAEKKGSH